MNWKIIVAITLVLGTFVQVGVIEAEETSVGESYQKQINLDRLDIVVPTVVELPLPEIVPTNERFLVFQHSNGLILQTYLQTTVATEANRLVPEILSGATTDPVVNIVDGDLDTFMDFPVQSNQVNTASILIASDRPIRTSEIQLRLDQYVALPTTIEVTALNQQTGQYEVVVASRRLGSRVINFPEVIATSFIINLGHIQPLRISEITIQDKDLEVSRRQSIRFLAQPGTPYTIYYQSDSDDRVTTVESGNLTSDEDVLTLGPTSFVANPNFVPSDRDDDGLPDTVDNCVYEANPDQLDIDQNGRGDACDDFDRDGRINSRDNCINDPNRNQRDEDGDGIGDVCDDEESRFTEANPWVPWFGMGMALLVIIILFVIVATGPKPRQNMEP